MGTVYPLSENAQIFKRLDNLENYQRLTDEKFEQMERYVLEEREKNRPLSHCVPALPEGEPFWKNSLSF